jgi:alanyl-tRNA synthetase
LQFVCAKGRGAEGNMKVLAAYALDFINGKGGGNEAFAQGGGEKLLPGHQFLQLLVDHVQ